MKRRYPILLITLAALLCTSCAGDYYVANSFLKKHKRHSKSATEKIYVCLPQQIFHTNTSNWDLLDGLSEQQQDSVAKEWNRILPKVNDSIFLGQFANSLLYVLSKTHIPIVIVDEERLLPPPSKDNLILDVYALEAEEFMEHTRSDFYTRRGVYYAYDHDLRHFSANAWLQLNFDTSYFFKNVEMSEEATFTGTVLSLKDDKVTMKVEQTNLTVNDAYLAARQLGEDCAVNYIEKVVHEYIKAKKGTNEWYLYYSPNSNEFVMMAPYKDDNPYSFEKIK